MVKEINVNILHSDVLTIVAFGEKKIEDVYNINYLNSFHHYLLCEFISIINIYHLNNLYIKDPSTMIFIINGIIQTILLSICRVIVLYYCYFKFNYPYHSSIPKFNDAYITGTIAMDRRNINNKNTQKKYVRIVQGLIILNIIVIILDIIWVTVEPESEIENLDFYMTKLIMQLVEYYISLLINFHLQSYYLIFIARFA